MKLVLLLFFFKYKIVDIAGGGLDSSAEEGGRGSSDPAALQRNLFQKIVSFLT